MNLSYSLLTHIVRLAVVIALMLAPARSAAFSADTYAPASALAEGRWVKISVPQTGLYCITAADLRSWGFSDPSRVRIHGYGGQRISDHMTQQSYIDDVPMVQSVVTPRGLVFYAMGPETWTYDEGTWSHSLNPFATAGYYFVTESEAPARSIEAEGRELTGDREYAVSFTEHLYHEADKISPATLGLLLVGEDFRYTASQSFRFETRGAVVPSEAVARVNFLAASTGQSAVSLSAGSNAIELQGANTFTPTAEGAVGLSEGRFNVTADNTVLGVNFRGGGVVSMAYLDYLELLYERLIALDGGRLSFSTSSPAVELNTVDHNDVTVWDVTDPLNIMSMSTVAAQGGKLRWLTPYSGMRSYCAWSASAVLPSPKYAGTVDNQNLHARKAPDMVIVTTADNLSQANRVAALHDDLDVLVVTQDQVYNEFSSGAADPSGIRKMAKMFYDRSLSAADGEDGDFRYLLLFGRPTYDNRRLTGDMAQAPYETIPAWTTDTGLNENVAYCTDDFFAMLEDNSGLRWGNEVLKVAVGRIPATSAEDARVFVDRLADYITTPAGGEWAQRVVLTADDGDSSVHLLQTEKMYDGFLSSSRGADINYKKVYFGAYTLSNGVYAEAVSTFRREIEDGVLLWSFVGHATIDNLTGEGLLPPGEVYKLYLRKPLIFYGATCSFGRWDGNRMSGIEALCLRESGGAVAAISAVRPVYIALNELMSTAFSKQLFQADASGRFPTVGEAMMIAKNNVGSDTNKRRYVMLGDPAMRPATPQNRVEVLAVNGVTAVNPEEPPVISALQKVSIKGQVTDYAGNRLDDFNGSLAYTIFDAEYSTLSNEKDEFDREVSFEQQGNRVAAGRAAVTGGEFEITLTMPSEIADNYRPGAMSLYALSADKTTDAADTFRNFYIYGYDDQATADITAPQIEYMYMNHDSFEDGNTVNSAPMLIARVSDDTGINLSTAGVGHQMSVRIDGKDSYSDVAASFSPDDDGSPAGVVSYRLPELMPGEHKLEFKVWDVNGNSASKYLTFNVDGTVAPSIFDVWTDASPARTEANFYVTHDRPDEILNVTLEVFDFNGTLQWSTTSTGRAEMFSSSPVKWNLVNNSGQRVGRGIYIYRARIATADNPSLVSTSRSRRLAVASR
ncbi:MAG: type IX secretion system sortase PorU [Duncaniella sp.]|nr:type IX secretion system sortase PorU [Duncaniella sp.]